MPKRANDTSLEFIAKKLRKLEEKLKLSRRKKRNSSNSSSSSSCQYSDSTPNSSRPATPQGIIDCEEEASLILNHPNDAIDVNIPLTENNEGVSQIIISDQPPDDLIASSVQESAASAEILDILGADPSVTIEYGLDINNEVASRFTHVATSGLNKDVRKELLNKFLVPGNCTNISAPQLIAEIKAAVSEQVVKRDKAIESRQIQIAAGITALGRIISKQLCASEKDSELITDLMEVSRIFCDIQHSESEARRNFALYSVKKELKDQLSNTKIDKFLFGNNLSENIKSAKAVSKSSSDLKLEAPKKPKASAHGSTSSKNLNWKARTAARRHTIGLPPPRHQLPAMQSAPLRGNSSHGYTQRPKQTRRQ